MSRLAKWVLLLGVLGPSALFAAIENSGFRAGLFDDQGLPTESAKKLFALAQPPITLIRGVDIPLAAQDKNGKWQVLDDSACISVRFRISSDGRIDRFMVLDSKPKDSLMSAVLGAMQKWQFDESPMSRWMILPLTFSYVRELPNNVASRVQRKIDVVPEKPANCLVPLREEQIRLADGIELDVSRDAVYPPAETLRARGAGCVTIAFRAGTDGSPTDLDLLDAKPDQSYVDTAALDVQAWRLRQTPTPNPQYGFVRLGYAPMLKNHPIPDCMNTEFAAKHYQPSEAPK